MDSRVHAPSLPQAQVLDTVFEWTDSIRTDPRTDAQYAQIVPNKDNTGWTFAARFNAEARGPKGENKSVSFEINLPLRPTTTMPTTAELQREAGKLWFAWKLGPGVWKILPDVPVHPVIRLIATLRGAPDPGPWEDRVLIVA